MRLVVCPRDELPQFHDAAITHFVSLIDPEDWRNPPSSPASALHRVQLLFHDLDDIEVELPNYARYLAPSDEDVRVLVDFGKSLSALEDWGLLVHCEAGISRCSAAAITLLAAAGYPPQIAFGLVRRACSEMLPNRRILRIADDLLGLGGRLHLMADNYRRKAFLRAGVDDPTNILAGKSLRPGAGFHRML